MSPHLTQAGRGFVKTTLWFLLLSGVVSSLRKYFLIADNMNRQDARTYCLEKYTDLARVESEEEMSRLVAAGGGYQGEVWIGRHNIDPWVWSLIIYAGSKDGTWRNWGPGQPNFTADSCVGMLESDGLWYDHSCYTELPIVCYNETGSTAADKYIYVSQPMSFFSAQDYCMTNHKNMAFVRDSAENDIVKSKLPTGTLAHIGLFGSPWQRWADDSKSTFSAWATSQPQPGGGDCAASEIDQNGRWVNKPCETLLPFMCYTDKTYNFVVRAKFLKSTADLNDPAVQKAILAKIVEKMKEKITDDFDISWVEKPDANIFDTETP